MKTFARMFCIPVLAGCSLLCACGGGQMAGSSAPSTTPSSQWTMVWSDEFSGTAGSLPDAASWTFAQGLTPDGAQSYNCLPQQTTNGCDPKQPNVYLDGQGHLAIVARAATGAPNGMTTGRIQTATSDDTKMLVSAEYGRIEASIAVPADAGNQGVWPAFWMLGSNIHAVGWPASGEIDVMEYIGKKDLTEIYATLHGPGYAQPGLGVRKSSAPGWGGFHTYGMIWSKDQIQFYIDDPSNIYGTFTASQLAAGQSWPFNQPFYLLLDLNVGGGFPGNVDATTTYPQTMLVDYVRIYKSAGAAPANSAVSKPAQP